MYKCCNKCGKDISITEYNYNSGYCSKCAGSSKSSSKYSDNGEYVGSYSSWDDLGPNFK